MIPFRPVTHLRQTVSRIPIGDGKICLQGAILLLTMIAMAAVSPGLDKNGDVEAQDLLGFIGLYMGSGLVFLLAVRRISARTSARTSLGTAIVPPMLLVAVGLLMRLAMLPSTPIIENDYHRYLWDGALCANGHNPYMASPQQYLEDTPPKIASELRESDLRTKGEQTLRQINHPHIRTIYPPVAQGVFAVAYMIHPFDVIGLRLLYLLFDLATLGILFLLLRALKRNRAWLLVYWWNPLVVKELFNAVHMDVLIFPFILGALLLLLRNRPFWATVCIVLAAGVKLWPIVFLVFVVVHIVAGNQIAANPTQGVQTLWQRSRTVALCLLGAITLIALMAWPIYASQPDDTSGFITYTRHWRNNDGLFRLLFHSLKGVLSFTDYAYEAFRFARYGSGILYLGLLVLIVRAWLRNPLQPTVAFLLATAGLYLLSPTQFPWYATWLFPLLVLHHWFPFHLYVLLLPLYYLQYWLGRTGHMPWFDHGVVWLEHVPVWILLIYCHVTHSDAPSRYLRWHRKFFNAK